MPNQYVNKVVYGDSTLIDITDTTAVASDVASGKYFYLASGERVSGTYVPSPSGATLIVDTPDEHGGTIREITTDAIVQLQGQKTVVPSSSVQTIYPDEGYDGFASIIVDSAPGGGSGDKAEWNDVCFWDYDGTILYSYSAADFAALSSLPANPSHSGLTAQGWNWSLADAKAHVAANGFLDIGQIYVTDDGKTRYILHIENPATTLKIALTGSVTGNLTINWGDGSATETNTGTSAKTYEHIYATAGDYTLTIAVSSGTVSLGVINGTDDRTIFRGCHIGSNAKLLAQAFNTCMWMSYLTIPSDCDISAFSYSSMGVKCLILPSAFGTSEKNSAESLNEIICFAKQTNIYGAYGQFAQSRALKRVSIPLGRNNAGWAVQSFIECRSLKRFLIHDGCTGFGNANSTQDLFSLEKVTIPSSVTQIQSGSFSNVYSLQEVHMLATTPPTLGGTNVWSNRPSTFKIYVPYSADHSILTAYQTETNWSTFASYMQEETS